MRPGPYGTGATGRGVSSMTKSCRKAVRILMCVIVGCGIWYLAADNDQGEDEAVSSAQAQGLSVAAQAAAPHTQPVLTLEYTDTDPAPCHPVLRWERVDGAVMYDVEVLRRQGESYIPLMEPQRAYTNGIELAMPDDFEGAEFYYRVRGLDVKGHIVGEPSELGRVAYRRNQPFVERPSISSTYNDGNGTVLLYPVYDWLPVPGAASYEVEILDAAPENPNGTTASEHRIDVLYSESGQIYDRQPRYGSKPFYWRVRALAADGSAIGVWSEAKSFLTNPQANYEVATFGDSISHGGGSISYSPTDWAFSYQSYLSFPSVNLAESGDTSQMSLARFDRDVLPFHPRYLLIMMGSNNLRNGMDTDDIIQDMEAVRRKCLANGIRPVFLTLPPLNPVQIRSAFDDATDPDWQANRKRINAYIRSHVHIDVTPGMEDSYGDLRPELAVDGLHLDPAGKFMIAKAINEAWPQIKRLPESAFRRGA